MKSSLRTSILQKLQYLRIPNLIWLLVIVVLIGTCLVSFGAFHRTDEPKALPKATPTPELIDNRDLNRFASTEMSRSPTKLPDSSLRYRANKRYDNENWVFKKIRPGTGGVSRIDENEPPPLFPSSESDLIVVAEVISSEAFLSNDLGGVYTEYELRIRDILKDDGSSRADKTLKADREGGVVIYPGGERVLYQNDNRELYKVGSKYLLFLKKEGESPNHRSITSYEIVGEKILQVESGRSFDEFKDLSKSALVEMIRSQSRFPKPKNN